MGSNIKTDPAFLKTVDTNVEKLLVAVGTYGVSVAVMLAPVVTGLYRNSIMFRTSSGKGGDVGAFSGAKGKGGKIDQPEVQHTVRVGSGVIYAGAVEKKHGTMAASFDAVRRNLDALAKRIFS